MGPTEFFALNQPALETMDTDLAARVLNAPSIFGDLIDTRSGHKTLQLAGEDGRTKYRHSRIDPIRSAKKLIDQEAFDGLQVFFLLGLGLGYELDELYARMNKATAVIVIEQSMEVFRAWLETGDRREYLDHGNVMFCVAWPPEELYARMRNNMSRMFAGSIRLVQVPEAAQLHPDYYTQTRQALLEFIKVGAFMMKTSFTLARANLDNRLNNLPYYVSTPGVEWYKDKFKGLPGVCVLAGPSLEKNIELLREVKGRAPLISVSTTLKLMLNREILPDFTSVLDFQKISRNFFSDVDPKHQIPMLCDPKGNWDSIAGYAGPRFFYREDFIDNMFEDFSAMKKEWIQSGGTVAHLAFSFARYLGCDPIILVGQDLAYSGGLSHIPGTTYFSWWKAETNRFNHYEAVEWRFVRREIDKLVQAQDWEGNKIYMTDHFTSYARELEVMIKETEQTVVDATEGGVVLKGAKLMSLREAIDTYIKEPLDPALFAPPIFPAEEQRKRLQCSVEQLNKRIDEARTVAEQCEKALALLTTIRNRFRQDKDVQRLVTQVQSYNASLDAHPHLVETVSSLMVSDEYFKQIEDAKIDAEGMKGKERFEAQLNRDRNYMDALRNASREFARAARRSIAIIEGMLEALP